MKDKYYIDDIGNLFIKPKKKIKRTSNMCGGTFVEWLKEISEEEFITNQLMTNYPGRILLSTEYSEKSKLIYIMFL